MISSGGGPGVNVLRRIITLDAAGNLDLLGWVIITLPICLALWMTPSRSLALRSETR